MCVFCDYLSITVQITFSIGFAQVDFSAKKTKKTLLFHRENSLLLQLQH